MNKILWDLFQKTGNINYYILSKKIKEKSWGKLEVVKVEAIVLGETNYGESSKILKILTEKYGIISVMSKGCRNLKSKLRGVSSKMCYGDFHFYYKPNGISTLVDVDIKNSFRNILMDIEKISYATYQLDLVEQVAKHSEDNSIFNILIEVLCKMNDGYDAMILTNILELKMLNYLGIQPVIDNCSICGSSKQIVTIDPTSGGYICNQCYRDEKIYSSKMIKLIRMLYYVDVHKITKLEVHDSVKKELNEFIDLYYERYSGLYLKSKAFLKSLGKIG